MRKLILITIMLLSLQPAYAQKSFRTKAGLEQWLTDTLNHYSQKLVISKPKSFHSIDSPVIKIDGPNLIIDYREKYISLVNDSMKYDKRKTVLIAVQDIANLHFVSSTELSKSFLSLALNKQKTFTIKPKDAKMRVYESHAGEVFLLGFNQPGIATQEKIKKAFKRLAGYYE